MKIVRVPKNLALDPEGMQSLVAAYDSAVLRFQIPDRALLLKEQLAAAIFDIAKSGERNSEVISQRAIQKLTQLRNAPPPKGLSRALAPVLRYSGC